MKSLILGLSYLFLLPLLILGQDEDIVDNPDKRSNKKEKKSEIKQLSRPFQLGFEAAYANLNSSVRFEKPNGIVSAKVDLETHLGLDNFKFIYSGTFIYRITQRSGLYSYFYQVNRDKNNTLDRDIIFLGDTLKKGAHREVR